MQYQGTDERRLNARLIARDDADALAADWAALCDDAGQPNVFARPWMVLPAIDATLGAAPCAGLLLVEGGDGPVGLMPLCRANRLGRLPMPVAADWGHPNAFLSAIAVRKGRELDFWLTALPAMAGALPGARVAQFGALVEDGPVHAALLAAAAMLGVPVAVEQRIVRALCAEPAGAAAYWDANVRPKKRKELRRQWNRLGEMGFLNFATEPAADQAEAWIADFLDLESRGWKGRAGSALASDGGTRAFFAGSISAAAASGSAFLTALRLDGRAIAMLATLRDGAGGFSFKTAYDEDFARFSPGVLLQRESLSAMADAGFDWVDSCAAEDHPMIDSLWRERRAVVTLSMPLPGAASNRWLWQGAQAAMRGWHTIKGWRHGGAATPSSANPSPPEHDA